MNLNDASESLLVLPQLVVVFVAFMEKLMQSAQIAHMHHTLFAYSTRTLCRLQFSFLPLRALFGTGLHHLIHIINLSANKFVPEIVIKPLCLDGVTASSAYQTGIFLLMKTGVLFFCKTFHLISLFRFSIVSMISYISRWKSVCNSS